MAIREIYVIHHSHTDLGYTHTPLVTRSLHQRYIDQAIELTESAADQPEGQAFRWTCESTFVVEDWIEHSAPRRVDKFIELCQRGWIDVAALWCNFTPLFETEQYCRLLEPIVRFRRLGIPVRSAMNCDVNGLPWRLVDLLIDVGVDGLTMAVNGHLGKQLPNRPNAFVWQGPAGRKILVWNGYLYNDGAFYGIPYDIEMATVRVAGLIKQLEAAGYPHEFLLFQATSPGFGDNGPPDASLTSFVREWNRRESIPALRIATLTQFLNRLRAVVPTLPCQRGEWTDYWAFGLGAAARETAVTRASQERLLNADLLQIANSDDPARLEAAAKVSQTALVHASLYGEHTFGADTSVNDPENLQTYRQWAEKSVHAYQALATAQMLERDGLLDLARQVSHGGNAGVLVFNPHFESVRAMVQVPLHWLDPPFPISIAEIQSARGYGQRARSKPIFWAGPIDLPPLGYRWLGRQSWTDSPGTPSGLRATSASLESNLLRVDLDERRGGLLRLFDKSLDHQFLDFSDGPGGMFVLESVADDRGRAAYFRHQWTEPDIDSRLQWQCDWRASRRSEVTVRNTQVHQLPDRISVIQQCAAEGLKNLEYRFSLFNHREGLELTVVMDLEGDPSPHAIYLVFGLAMAQGRCRFDSMGSIVEADAEQLPGIARDFFSVQRWIDLSDDQHGLTIATPDVPLWMVGDFSFGRLLEKLQKTSKLIAWPINNYWDTNFPGRQSGRLEFRFVLYPHGRFDARTAMEQGQRSVHEPIIVPTTGQASGAWPLHGSLLEIESKNIVPVALRTLGLRRLLLRLQNLSDHVELMRIGNGLLRLKAAAHADPIGTVIRPLALGLNGVTVTLEPRELATVVLDVSMPFSSCKNPNES
jgi:hypothetical protein